VANIVTIEVPADPRIAAYRDIRERDLVGRQGLFIAEGEVVLRVLLGRALHQAASLFLAEKRLDALAPLIETLPTEVPVFVASQEVMDGVAGFHLHRGMLALGRRSPSPSPVELLAGAGKRAVILVLLGIANHDNMGGIFRNAAAFGTAGVILDSACVDPLYRKAIRVSVGGTLIVPFAKLDPGDDGLTLIAKAGFEPIALSPKGGSSLNEIRRADRTAVLLGSEGHGLPDELLARTQTVRIPMAEGFDSLNVATASGIVLHHLVVAP